MVLHQPSPFYLSLSRTPSLPSLDATFPEAETFAEIRWKSGLSYKFHATARRHARHANLFANSFVTSREYPSGLRTRPSYACNLRCPVQLPRQVWPSGTPPTVIGKTVFFSAKQFAMESAGWICRFNEIGRLII